MIAAKHTLLVVVIELTAIAMLNMLGLLQPRVQLFFDACRSAALTSDTFCVYLHFF